jgi:hypothetical protein
VLGQLAPNPELELGTANRTPNLEPQNSEQHPAP